MVSLLSWAAFPVVVYAVAAGLGLLAGRVARHPLAPWLVAPVGLCVGVAASLPVYKLGGSVWIAAPLLVLLAAAGFALTRGAWRERLHPGWPGAALLAAYALYMAPVVLSGHWTWLGYNFVNDTAVNMVLIDHVAQNGVRLDLRFASTTSSIVNGTLLARYPMGLHALVASLHGVLWFLPLEAVYQPFIAVAAGLAAMALAGLAGRVGVPGPYAAALGTIAAGANLTYQYAAHGSFKEVTLLMVVAVAAAQSREVLDARLQAGAVALLGIVFAAGVLVFSTAAGAYVALFAAVLLAATLLGPARPRATVLARAAAVGVAVAVVAALPGLEDALAFGRSAGDYYAAEGPSVAILGHLLRPLPLQEATGIWPSGDYRVPLIGVEAGIMAAVAVLVVALLLVAAFTEVRRRRLAGLIALVPCLVVYLVAEPRLGPYAAAKLLVLLAPAVVFAAGLGAWYLGRRVPAAGAIAALVLAGGVLGSDALAYHDVRLAPVERLEALEDAVGRAPKDGPVLTPEWEEWAKYYARERQVNVGPESFSPAPVDLITYFPYFGHSVDLDQLKPLYVRLFPAIVLRRGPDSSRPPANYRLAYRNRFYELWRRDPRGPTVLEHLPLQQPLDGSAPPRCQDVRDLAERTRPGSQLLAMPGGPLPMFDYSARPPVGWVPTQAPGMVAPMRPGRATGRVELAAGAYRVWLRGSTGRGVEVSVDGRRIAEVVGVNTPEQWLDAGEVRLRGGTHRVDVLRPGGAPLPGNGFAGTLGPVAFEPLAPAEPVRVRPQDAEERLCGRHWDWIERVR